MLANLSETILVNTPAKALPASQLFLASWWDELWWQGETGQSNFADGVDAVFFYTFWISAAFFALLMFLMVVWAFQYRRKPGTHAPVSNSHNTKLEVAWTVIPTILLGVMFVWGFKEYARQQVAPIDSEEIHVTASQWAWEWVYPNGATSLEREMIADMDSPVFALPVGRPVKFVMSSTDVIHSMFFAAFRIKRDVFPNRYTVMWVEAQEATHIVLADANGKYLGLERIDPEMHGHYLACTEYCGDQHSQMWARIVLLSPTDYERWKEAQASTEDIPPLVLGEMLYATKGCNACHSIDGSQKTGPTWKGSWGKSRMFADGTSAVMDENYIRQSVLDPASQLVDGYPNQMVTYQGRLTDREIRSIGAYMKSLSSDAGDRQEAQEESDAEMAAKKAAAGGE